ncbi:MAG: PAS domain S-box protein [Candidatus Rokubacteria bacterium]|nr:PAS domain S-box protein [Candidatus Rokubacteria bacterium]MBI2554869.1 PAS domain S-box protein [Candidatus Rokubacteria bacterium]
MDLDELLSNTADGVCAITTEGKITLWNRSAEKILGYTAREVVGRACCDVFVGRDATGNRLCYRGCHIQTLVKMGEPVQHFEMATRTKGGKPAWIDVSILVVPGSRNGLQTTVHFFRDVTATHELQALLRERAAQPKAAPAASPDLSSPLTRREIEILRLMTGGANTKVMADRLHVSPATVRNHVQNIFGKLGVHSRLEAVAHATTNGLL